MQIIIAGCDRVGGYIARKLSEMGHDLVLVDEKEGSLAALEDLDCLKITGKAIDVEVQRSAGAETADALLAVSGDEKGNVMAAEVAQIIFNVPLVLARTLNARNNEVYADMGLSTICTTRVVAERFIKKLLDSERRQRADIFGHVLNFQREALLPQFFGQTLEALEKEIRQRVFALLRRGELILAKPALRLQEGDWLLFAMTMEAEK